MKKLLVVLLVLVVAGIAAAGYLFRNRLESAPPQISVAPNVDALGLRPLEVTVEDAGSGLKSVIVTLTAAGAEHRIAAEELRPPAASRKYVVDASKIAGIKEGPATLRAVARDNSIRNSFAGNEAIFDKQLAIDVTPPTLELVADDRYINFGGVGALVYKPSADTESSGVRVGSHYFPGFKGAIQGKPDNYFVLFAHPYDAAPEDRAVLVATDKAGNTREMRLAYELKNVKYKKSTINVSDSFLQNKVAPLLADVAKRQGSPKDVFIAVNKGVRKQNEDKITEVTKKATPQILWKGAFSQLSNSKVEANFADSRTYTYKGEQLDTAYHLGYDLSVTKNYPVEAANSGNVAFVGDLGLYGNAVIIDHGLGLYTLYGHLSSIDVKAGDKVAARQIIGKTGETGFAGGDHLHYGVYLDGVAVLPVEWWDPKWIRDNVEPKLEGRSGQETAEAQQAERIARKRRR
jgi:murein DD-endopeptidase MepM/ murein hydrolase activator NlpD